LCPAGTKVSGGSFLQSLKLRKKKGSKGRKNSLGKEGTHGHKKRGRKGGRGHRTKNPNGKIFKGSGLRRDKPKIGKEKSQEESILSWSKKNSEEGKRGTYLKGRG